MKESIINKNIIKTDSVNMLIDDSFSDLDTFSFEYTYISYIIIILV